MEGPIALGLSVGGYVSLQREHGENKLPVPDYVRVLKFLRAK